MTEERGPRPGAAGWSDLRIAFLRAINVGGHTVKMDRLRGLFQELDLRDVATFIASGNVIFRADQHDAGALERRIEAHLEAALGYEVATFVRTADDVADLATARPFGDEAMTAGVATSYVGFLKQPPATEAERRVLALATADDDLRVIGRELYWRCRVPSRDSAVSGALLEKALGAPATLRNVNTVRRLAAKYVGAA